MQVWVFWPRFYTPLGSERANEFEQRGGQSSIDQQQRVRKSRDQTAHMIYLWYKVYNVHSMQCSAVQWLWIQNEWSTVFCIVTVMQCISNYNLSVLVKYEQTFKTSSMWNKKPVSSQGHTSVSKNADVKWGCSVVTCQRLTQEHVV